MPRAQDIDHEVRERLGAWVRYFRAKYVHHYETVDDFARALDLRSPTISNIINRKRSAGLDVLVKLHTKFHISTDILLDTDPPISGANDDQARPAAKQQPRSPGIENPLTHKKSV